jgi:cysteinyl-tRNA synthetase
VRSGNAALDAGDEKALRQAFGAVHAMTDVLGINPRRWASESASDLTAVIDSLVQVAIGQRTAARERKDYTASDAIRDQLAAAGVLVEDTPSGPRWTLKG